MVGFINGEERMKAITALKGIPPAMSERPTGIAAYVGRGETKPMRAPKTIRRYSFFEEKLIFRFRKNLITTTFSAILKRRYGYILRKRSIKSSTIRKVYVPSNKLRI
jgi:hypothetical protein